MISRMEFDSISAGLCHYNLSLSSGPVLFLKTIQSSQAEKKNHNPFPYSSVMENTWSQLPIVFCLRSWPVSNECSCVYLQFQVKLTSTVSYRTVRSLEVHTKIHLTVALRCWEGGRCHLICMCKMCSLQQKAGAWIVDSSRSWAAAGHLTLQRPLCLEALCRTPSCTSLQAPTWANVADNMCLGMQISSCPDTSHHLFNQAGVSSNYLVTWIQKETYLKCKQIDRTKGQTEMKAARAGLSGGGQDGAGIPELESPAPVLGWMSHHGARL